MNQKYVCDVRIAKTSLYADVKEFFALYFCFYLPQGKKMYNHWFGYPGVKRVVHIICNMSKEIHIKLIKKFKSLGTLFPCKKICRWLQALWRMSGCKYEHRYSHYLI